MPVQRFDWQPVKGHSTTWTVAEAAKAKGLMHIYCGSVLFIRKGSGTWLQFMLLNNKLVFRRVPGQFRAQGSCPPGPRFQCSGCNQYRPASEISTIWVNQRDYLLCPSCLDEGAATAHRRQ